MKKKIFVFLLAALFVLSGCRIGTDPTTPVQGGDGVYELVLTTQNEIVASGASAYVIATLTKTSGSSASLVSNANIEFTIDGTANGAKLEPAKNATSELGETYSIFSAELPEGVDEMSYSVIAKYSNLAADTIILKVMSDYVEPSKTILRLVADPSRVPADGKSYTNITAILINEDGVVVPGETIKFKTTSGLLGLAQPTNDIGQSTCPLVSIPRNLTTLVTAQLVSDPTVSDNLEVDFFGVLLTSTMDKGSIVPNGKDTVTITATLLDAAQSPIVREPIKFKPLDENTFKIVYKDDVTNNSGKAIVKLVGTGIEKIYDSLAIEAAGAKDTASVSYSSKYIKIDTAGFGNNYTVSTQDAQNVTKLKITYFESDKVTPISGADFTVSVSKGGIVQGTGMPSSPFVSVTLAPTETSLELTLDNPTLSGDLAVNVIAKKTDAETKKTETTTKAETIYIKAGKLFTLNVEATPEVISIGGEEAQVIATARDASGNFCVGETIFFTQVAGLGGSGELAPPPFAVTDKFGRAIVNFISGDNESAQKGIRIVAESESGIKSIDTAIITVANAVANIQLSENISKLIAGTATYSKELEAVVSDINNNPVPDGTPIVFSARIIGWGIWMRGWELNGSDFSTGTGFRKLNFDDYNWNYIRDNGEGTWLPGEEYPLARGEQKAMAGLDRSFEPGPKFRDINGNGVRDYMFKDAGGNTVNNDGYEFPEPWWSTSDLPSGSVSETTPKGLTFAFHPIEDVAVYFLDYNRNGRLDISEPLMDPATGGSIAGSTDNAELIAYYNNAPGTVNSGSKLWAQVGKGNYKDIDWNSNGVAEPTEKGNAVIVTRTVKTEGGTAKNMLTYGQTDAWRLCVEVWAEVKGIRSNSIKFEPLPILDADVKYFDAFQGKDNLW